MGDFCAAHACGCGCAVAYDQRHYGAPPASCACRCHDGWRMIHGGPARAAS